MKANLEMKRPDMLQNPAFVRILELTIKPRWFSIAELAQRLKVPSTKAYAYLVKFSTKVTTNVTMKERIVNNKKEYKLETKDIHKK